MLIPTADSDAEEIARWEALPANVQEFLCHLDCALESMPEDKRWPALTTFAEAARCWQQLCAQAEYSQS